MLGEHQETLGNPTSPPPNKNKNTTPPGNVGKMPGTIRKSKSNPNK